MSSRASCRSGRRPRSAACRRSAPSVRRSAQIGRNRSPTPLRAAFSCASASVSGNSSNPAHRAMSWRLTSRAVAIHPLPVQRSATTAPFSTRSSPASTSTSVSGRGIRQAGDTRNRQPKKYHSPKMYWRGYPVSRCRTAASSASFPYRRSRSQSSSARPTPQKCASSRQASSCGASVAASARHSDA